METLPIELLRLIGYNLYHVDLFSLFPVSRKFSQIPNEHFWYSKVLMLYPERLAAKLESDPWINYSYHLLHPIVRYRDIYKIGDENKIRRRDCLRLNPNYTWKQVEPLDSEQLSQELLEYRQRKQEDKRDQQAQFIPRLKQMMSIIIPNPTLRPQLLHLIQTLKAQGDAETQEQLDLFCEHLNPDLLFQNVKVFPDQETIDITPKIEVIFDNPEKIYVITTQAYELIALICNDQKFLLNSELYPDSYYIFALTSDIVTYKTLREVLDKLPSDDEIGIGYLLETIKYLSREIIEDVRVTIISGPEWRLSLHLQ